MEHRNSGHGEDTNGNKASKSRAVFVPLPVMGHVMAMVEFAKQLVHLHSNGDHRIAITFLNIQHPNPNPQISRYIASVASSDTAISFVDLPGDVDQAVDSLGKTVEAAVTAFVDLHKPLVRSALRDLMARSRVSALVLDYFCTSMIDVADEVGVHPYVFFSSSAGFLNLMLQATTVASKLPDPEDRHLGFLSPQFRRMTVDVAGLATPFPLASMPAALSNPSDDAFAAFTLHARRFSRAKGIVINTFSELEPDAVKILEGGLHLRQPGDKTPPPQVYAVGPILSLGRKNTNSAAPTRSERQECMRWLDEQPPESVVFLCFGSMGSFPAAQVKEIAVGLEESGQRFLWVLRRPPTQSEQQWRNPNPTDADLKEILPEGFLERTKATGLVWPAFAPQIDILAHAAVGGFVTHCGWNSCLEGLWCGVPMAAWPLYAEQHFNAFEMVKEMGVALDVAVDRMAGNAATAEEVKRAVTSLVGPESVEVRKKTRLVKAAARSAFHEGGSSSCALHKFAERLLL